MTPRNFNERRRLAHLSLAAVVLFAAVVATVLYRFPPTAYSFYPLCPIHEYLHVLCPGCGTTRALYALLHGRVAEALRLNPLTIAIALPLAVAYGVIAYARAVRNETFRWPQIPTPAVYAGVGVAIGFMVLRNL